MAIKDNAAFLERGNWREAIVVVMKVSKQDGCSIVALPPKPDGHLKRIQPPISAAALEARVAVLADDDVIVDRDAERLCSVDNHLCHVDVSRDGSDRPRDGCASRSVTLDHGAARAE